MSPLELFVRFAVMFFAFWLLFRAIKGRPYKGAPRYTRVDAKTIESLQGRTVPLTAIEATLPEPFRKLLALCIYFTQRAATLASVDEGRATRFANFASPGLHFIQLMVRFDSTNDPAYLKKAAEMAEAFDMCAKGQWAKAAVFLDDLRW